MRAMDIIRDAWEFQTDDQALLVLTGHSTREEYLADRESRAREVLQLCAIQPPMRGFEIGSGDGTVARILARHCRSLDCCDVSRAFLEKARGHCIGCPNVRFHLIGSNYLDFLEPESREFGFSLNVFIHFNVFDVYHYLRSAGRILVPGGVFYFDACTVGPQTLGLFAEHAELYRADPTHIHGLLNFNPHRGASPSSPIGRTRREYRHGGARRPGGPADARRWRPLVRPKFHPSGPARFRAKPRSRNHGRAPNPSKSQAPNRDLGATWADPPSRPSRESGSTPRPRPMIAPSMTPARGACDPSPHVRPCPAR
jgi:SAM-dependent methyltransferase